MIRIAYIKNANQFDLFTIEAHKNHGPKCYDLQEMKNKSLHLVLFDSTESNDEIMSVLAEEYRFQPVRALNDLGLDRQKLESLHFSEAKVLLQKCREAWIIQNNLKLLESLFPTLDHLKNLWPNDRSSFMEELWFILRNNLGSEDLVLIYNSLKKAEKENEKNRLVQSRVAGDRYPETYEGEDFEKKVIAHYQGLYEEQLVIREYSEDKGQLVATISLKGSPLILMAKVSELTRLQQNLIKTLFDGLQH